MYIIGSDNKTLIQYKGKQKEAIYSFQHDIDQVIVVGDDIIVGTIECANECLECTHPYNIFWNGKSIDDHDLRYFRILNTANGLFVTNNGSKNLYRFGLTVKLTEVIPFFKSSESGNNIAFMVNKKLYVQRINVVPIVGLFKESHGAKLVPIELNHMGFSWLNEDKIFVNGNIVFNINTNSITKIGFECWSAFLMPEPIVDLFTIGHDLLIFYDFATNSIHNVATKLDFINYDRHTNTLQTENGERYQISKNENKYTLQKVENLFI